MKKTIYQIECKKWVYGSGWSYSCIMETLHDVGNISKREMLKSWLDSKEFDDEIEDFMTADYQYRVNTLVFDDEYLVSEEHGATVWLSDYLAGKEVR